MTPDQGKRTNRRVAANVPAEYVQTGGVKGSSEITQLSAGGCILRATDLDPRGSDVFLHARLGPENNEEVHLQARVVHVNPESGSGLEFIDVSPEARELLRQYVANKVVDSTLSARRPQ